MSSICLCRRSGASASLAPAWLWRPSSCHSTPWTRIRIYSKAYYATLHDPQNTAKPATIGPYSENIHVDDLQATLRAHQEANWRASAAQAPKAFCDHETTQKRLCAKLNSKAKRKVLRTWKGLPQQPKTLKAGLSQIRKALADRNSEIFFDTRLEQIKQEALEQGIEADFGVVEEARAFFAYPWTQYQKLQCHLTPSSKLDDEIEAFESYMQLTEAEQRSAQKVVDRILKLKPGRLAVTIVGSRAAGLATPDSNIDLKVQYSGKGHVEIAGTVGSMASESRTISQFLTYLLKDSLLCQAEQHRGRVKHLTTTHDYSNVGVQVFATGPFDLQIEMVKTYLQDFPTLRPLYLVLHQLLRIRNLSTTARGGISSYPLFMMIVLALKNADILKLKTISSQLLFILDFWTEANVSTRGYTVEPAGSFVRRTDLKFRCESWQGVGSTVGTELDEAQNVGIEFITSSDVDNKDKQLILQDPVDYSNDLGAGAKIELVQEAFRSTQAALLEQLSSSEALEQQSILKTLVGRDYLPFEMQRSVLARFSTGVVNKSRDYSLEAMMADSQDRMTEITKRESCAGKAGHLERLIQLYQIKPVTNSAPEQAPELSEALEE